MMEIEELFDTHFHYYGESSPTEFWQTVEAEAAVPPQSDAGIPRRISAMAVGGDYLESCRAREFAQRIESAWFAVGVHPHEAAEELSVRHDFSEFRGHPKLAAIGELGLDYYYEQSAREEQRRIFAEFLNLALEWDLPAIVHIRDKDDREDAYREAYELLEPFAGAGGRFVVHCFAGSPEWAEKFLALGGYCGVTGMVTFRKAENIRNVVRMIPDERLLIETDSPYLAPVPHRGAANHPGYLVLIAAQLARERGQTLADLAQLTTANGYEFFRLRRKGE